MAAIDINSSDASNITQETNVTQVTNISEDIKAIDVQDELKDPNLSIHVNDIHEGKTATIEVYADKSFSERLYVDVGNNLIPVKVSEGYGVCHFEKASLGHYNAKVSFQGNDEFKASQCSGEFDVLKKEKKDSNLEISVKDHIQFEPTIIEFNADNDFTGTVVGSVGNKTFTILVENGYGKVRIDDLLPGDYKVSAKYFGDGRYNEWNGSADFTVLDKKDLNMNVDIEEIFITEFNDTHPMSVGEKIEVTINTDKDFTGTVNVYVCNETHAIHVENGYAHEYIWTGKIKGTYTAITTFPGNDHYKESKVYTSFEMWQYGE